MALGLPLVALAQPGRPDPAEPKTAASPLRYQSAFSDYKPWQDIGPGDWLALNESLRAQGAGGSGHAGHAMPMPAAATPPAPAASKPVAPPQGAHPHHHGAKR